MALFGISNDPRFRSPSFGGPSGFGQNPVVGHSPLPKNKAAAPTGHSSKSTFHAKPKTTKAAPKTSTKPATTTTRAGGAMPTLPPGTKASPELARNGMTRATRPGRDRKHPRCAAGVADAIAKTTGSSPRNNANALGRDLLRSGKFKEAKGMSLKDALKIPGAVIAWDRTSTKAGSKYGHIAISQGDGHTSTSDYVESDTVAASRRMNRTGMHVLIPTA
jgi:hypothetical protein